MDSPITIRSATEADLDALTDVWERAASTSHRFMDPDDFAAMRPAIRDAFLPSMDVQYAEVEGRPIAFIGSRDSHVELLYVDPPFQGQGLGIRLLAVVGEHGATSVEVYADNLPAVAFYRSQGFVEVRRRERDAADRPYPMLELRR